MLCSAQKQWWERKDKRGDFILFCRHVNLTSREDEHRSKTEKKNRNKNKKKIPEQHQQQQQRQHQQQTARNEQEKTHNINNKRENVKRRRISCNVTTCIWSILNWWAVHHSFGFMKERRPSFIWYARRFHSLIRFQSVLQSFPLFLAIEMICDWKKNEMERKRTKERALGNSIKIKSHSIYHKYTQTRMSFAN